MSRICLAFAKVYTREIVLPGPLAKVYTPKLYFHGTLRNIDQKVTKNSVKIRKFHRNSLRSRKFIPAKFLKEAIRESLYSRKLILAPSDRESLSSRKFVPAKVYTNEVHSCEYTHVNTRDNTCVNTRGFCCTGTNLYEYFKNIVCLAGKKSSTKYYYSSR